MNRVNLKRDRLNKYLASLKIFPTSVKAAAVAINTPECVLPFLLFGTKYMAFNGKIYSETEMNPTLLRKWQIEAIDLISSDELEEAAARGYIFKLYRGRMTVAM